MHETNGYALAANRCFRTLKILVARLPNCGSDMYECKACGKVLLNEQDQI